MISDFRFLVRDMESGIKRAHVNIGTIDSDSSGLVWLEREFFTVEGTNFQHEKIYLAKSNIPEDLVFYEFNDLDPNNYEEILAFQRQYGLLTSIFRTPSYQDQPIYIDRPDKRNGYESYGADLESINTTSRLIDLLHLRNGERGKASSTIWNSVTSVEEASQCIKRIQDSSELLLRVRNKEATPTEVEFALHLVNTLNEIVVSYLPIIELTDDADSPLLMPLSICLIAQLLWALCDSEAFHICRYEHCNRQFQWKRNKDGIPGRRTGSLYCCDDHQIRQKRINQRKRRQREARSAKKDRSDEQ